MDLCRITFLIIALVPLSAGDANFSRAIGHPVIPGFTTASTDPPGMITASSETTGGTTATSDGSEPTPSAPIERENDILWSGCEARIPPSCGAVCNVPTHPDNAYDRRLADGRLVPVPVTVRLCLVNTTKDTCSVDIDDLVGDMWNATEDTTQLYGAIQCMEKTRVVFTKSSRKANPNLFAVLDVKYCDIHWNDLSFLGQMVDLRVLFLGNWRGENENATANEYLDNCTEVTDDELILHEARQLNLQPPLKGLESIGSIIHYHGVPSTVATQSYQIVSQSKLSPLIIQHYWPKMAELSMDKVYFSDQDAQQLTTAMPLLQTLDLTSSQLSKPSTFPWRQDVMELPLALARTRHFNYHYATAFNITLLAYLYRRIYTIKDNPNLSLSTTTFSGYIQRIQITNCGVETVHPLAFVNVTGLEYLDLSNNQIQNIPGTVFPHHGDSLKQLIFTNNQLTSLGTAMFTNITSVTHIYLNNNRLNSISTDVFSPLADLKHLDLSYNSLTSLDADIFSASTLSIESVNFQHNQIQYIPLSVFYVRDLSKIDFSDNQITFTTFLDVISKIDSNPLITGNTESVSSITDPFKPVTYKIVNLSRNHMTHFNSTIAERTMTLLKLFMNFYNLNLEGNEISCDCELYDLYLYLREQQKIQDRSYQVLGVLPSYFTDFLCYNPEEVRGIAVVSVPNTTFSCPAVMEECPGECICRERSVDGLVVVDCRASNLTSLPLAVPAATTSLLMRDNLIRTIDSTNPAYLAQLSVLDISDNQITSIHPEFFQSLDRLQMMYLHGNELQRLPESIQHLPVASHLTLMDNHLICDCETIWFWEFLRDARFRIDDVESIFCASGKPQGDILIYVDRDDFICEAGERNARTAIGVVVPFFLLLFLGLVVAYKYRGEIKLYLYIHYRWHPFDRADDSDIIMKRYDAFVSYNHSDHPWVLNQLKLRLEDNDPKFRLCIHDRDFALGESITCNIANSVTQSRRTILVLSKQFLKSEWCAYEFREAHYRVLRDRSNYLIIIVLEELDMEDLDKDMQLYMKTNTYLGLDNKWFWEKLLYAMPQTPLSQLQTASNLRKAEKVGSDKKAKKVKCASHYTPAPVSATGRRIYKTDTSAGMPSNNGYIHSNNIV